MYFIDVYELNANEKKVLSMGTSAPELVSRKAHLLVIRLMIGQCGGSITVAIIYCFCWPPLFLFSEMARYSAISTWILPGYTLELPCFC